MIPFSNQTQNTCPPKTAVQIFAPTDEFSLREALKRCSSSTVDAACAYRRTAQSEYLPVIIYGIVERYVGQEARGKLRTCDHTLRLVEDLGVDSLAMMEIVMLLEEAIPISIKYEDLRALRTLAEVERFVASKLE